MKSFLSLLAVASLSLGAGCSNHSDALGVWKNDTTTLTLESDHSGKMTVAPVSVGEPGSGKGELPAANAIFGWHDLEDHEVGLTSGGVGEYFMKGKISDDNKTLTLRNQGQEIILTKS
jgi:hypothetical protein